MLGGGFDFLLFICFSLWSFSLHRRKQTWKVCFGPTAVSLARKAAAGISIFWNLVGTGRRVWGKISIVDPYV